MILISMACKSFNCKVHRFYFINNYLFILLHERIQLMYLLPIWKQNLLIKRDFKFQQNSLLQFIKSCGWKTLEVKLICSVCDRNLKIWFNHEIVINNYTVKKIIILDQKPPTTLITTCTTELCLLIKDKFWLESLSSLPMQISL